MAKYEKCDFLKFQSNRIRGHNFCTNWLKYGPDTPYMISNKVAEAFLKIQIISDFMLIFHEKSQNRQSPKKPLYLCLESGPDFSKFEQKL